MDASDERGAALRALQRLAEWLRRWYAEVFVAMAFSGLLAWASGDLSGWIFA